jgi:uncharacterized protein with ParB-like and HNH nuclease domain
MELKPDFLKLGDLLRGRLFRIPDYQRAYSWQIAQRKNLFDDIKTVGVSDDDHFMATFVGLKRPKNTVQIAADEFSTIELVDGQQRLTTIAILLKAIEQAFDSSKEDEADLAKELRRLLVKGDDVSLLLLQTNHDSSHAFTDYLRTGNHTQQSAETAAEQNILDAIKECKKFVAEWQNGTSRLITLLSILKNRLKA